jgi:hypothetical protein
MAKPRVKPCGIEYRAEGSQAIADARYDGRWCVAQDTPRKRYSWSGATSHDLEKLRYTLVDGVGKDLRELTCGVNGARSEPLGHLRGSDKAVTSLIKGPLPPVKVDG